MSRLALAGALICGLLFVHTVHAVPYGLHCDFNGDGTIAAADLRTVAQNFGQQGVREDVNNDGIVSSVDLMLCSQWFGSVDGQLKTWLCSGTQYPDDGTGPTPSAEETPGPTPGPWCPDAQGS